MGRLVHDSKQCNAVGLYAGGTLIESWNGKAWSVVTSPNAKKSAGDELLAVSCTSATSCLAVGDSFNVSDIDQTLVESWNGNKWSVVSSPDEQASDNALSAVACTTSTHCVAVGNYFNGAVEQQTLVESWNGGEWSLVLSPNQGSDTNDLRSVSSAGSASWVAAGYYDVTSTTQALVESTFPLQSIVSVTSVSSNPVAGQPIAVSVQVTGVSAGSTAPTGRVTVSDGKRNCTAILKRSGHTAHGTCSIAEQAVGHYAFTASYPGDSVYGASVTAAATKVTVRKAKSKTSLGLSTAKATYGDEEAEHLSVTVSPEFAGSTPAGTVKVAASTVTLCVITLSSGKGSCDLSSKKLPVGTHHLVATYSGSKNLLASASSTETLSVAK